MADDEFLWEFLVESYENLDNIDSRLVALESNQDPDSVAAIFRSMHTIKGTSGFFGFALVERVGHVAENLLGRIRDGEDAGARCATRHRLHPHHALRNHHVGVQLRAACDGQRQHQHRFPHARNIARRAALPAIVIAVAAAAVPTAEAVCEQLLRHQAARPARPAAVAVAVGPTTISHTVR